jgi:hypothetical protein
MRMFLADRVVHTRSSLVNGQTSLVPHHYTMSTTIHCIGKGLRSRFETILTVNVLLNVSFERMFRRMSCLERLAWDVWKVNAESLLACYPVLTKLVIRREPRRMRTLCCFTVWC